MKPLKHKMTIHIFGISVLILLLLQASLASSSCGDMRVLKGAQEVTQDVCVTEYLTQDCETFSQTLNVSLLPEDDMRGKSVQRPSEFRVTEKFKSYSSGSGLTHRPGLAFQWKSPSSGDARDSIKGFYLRVRSEDGNQTVCRIFSIDHSLYTGKLEFHYTIPDIAGNEDGYTGRNYTAKIYSLPPPSNPEEMKDRENFKSSIVTTNAPFESKFPAHWKTGISVTPSAEERSIDVHFSLPEPGLKYGFTRYDVKLVKVNIDSNNFFEIKEVSIASDYTHDTGHTRFTNLSPDDVYQVVIEVIDPFRNDARNCLCYKMVPDPFEGTIKDCANSCGISRSATFDLDGNINPPLHPTTSLQPSTPSSTPKTTTSTSIQPPPKVGASSNGDDDDDNNITGSLFFIIPMVIGCILSAVFAVCCIWYFRHRCCIWYFRRRHKRGSNIIGGHYLSHGLGPEDKKSTFVKMDPSPPKSVPCRKTVYLMFSSDHEYHQEMMKKFVAFLQTHCLCDVVVPSEMDIRQHPGGGASWLAHKLSSCHNIIFVDSMGANLRLAAFGEQKRYKPVQSGPEGDLFSLGLEHIYKELIPNRMADQLILVSFTEELSKGLLFVSSEYHLPKYLSPFLQKLHNFSHDDIDAYRNCLPLMPDLIEELSEASALLTATEKVQNFEQTHPEWFTSYFELVRPKMDRIMSIPESNADSDYSSLHEGPRSVSPTLCSSKDSSPTSDYGEPNFEREDPDMESRVGWETRPYHQSPHYEPSCVTIVTQPTRSEVFDGASLLSDGGGYNEHNAGHIVRPPGVPEVNCDQFSNVLRDLNQVALSSRSGGEKIQPPRGLSPSIATSNDGISRLLRDINNERELTSSHSESVSHRVMAERVHSQGVRPPRDKLPIADGDGISSVLRSMNLETENFHRDY